MSQRKKPRSLQASKPTKGRKTQTLVDGVQVSRRSLLRMTAGAGVAAGALAVVPKKALAKIGSDHGDSGKGSTKAIWTHWC